MICLSDCQRTIRRSESIVCEFFIRESDFVAIVQAHFLIRGRADGVNESAVGTVLVNDKCAAAAAHNDGVQTADRCIIIDAVINTAALAADLELIPRDGNALTVLAAGQRSITCAAAEYGCRAAVSTAENRCLSSAAAKDPRPGAGGYAARHISRMSKIPS